MWCERVLNKQTVWDTWNWWWKLCSKWEKTSAKKWWKNEFRIERMSIGQSRRCEVAVLFVDAVAVASVDTVLTDELWCWWSADTMSNRIKCKWKCAVSCHGRCNEWSNVLRRQMNENSHSHIKSNRNIANGECISCSTSSSNEWKMSFFDRRFRFIDSLTQYCESPKWKLTHIHPEVPSRPPSPRQQQQLTDKRIHIAITSWIRSWIGEWQWPLYGVQSC